jgi:aquaporin Z
MRTRQLHWREDGREGALLGLFMIAACLLAILLEYPDSPAHRALPNGDVRRLLPGIGMGLTAIGLISSPVGAAVGRT